MADQTIKIEFQVLESNSPKFLWVGDNSVWEYSENLPAFIWITLPGSANARKYPFKKYALNSFNSNNFGLSCHVDCDEQKYVDLPDGIYTICLKSGYEGIEKIHYYLKTDRLKLELSKTVIRDIDNDSDEFVKAMFKIKWYILKAESLAHVGNFNDSQRYFREAQKKLKKYTTCTDCF